MYGVLFSTMQDFFSFCFTVFPFRVCSRYPRARVRVSVCVVLFSFMQKLMQVWAVLVRFSFKRIQLTRSLDVGWPKKKELNLIAARVEIREYSETWFASKNTHTQSHTKAELFSSINKNLRGRCVTV